MQPITVENLDELTLLATLGEGNINDIDWSPDGTTIAVASTRGIRLHNADDLNAPTRLLTTPESVEAVAYSPDGTLIAGIRESAIWLWTVETGAVMRVIELEGEAEARLVDRALEFSPDGERVTALSCTADKIDDYYRQAYCTQHIQRIFSVASGDLLESFELGRVTSVQFSPDWSLMGYGLFGSDAVTLVDVESGEQVDVVELSLYSEWVRFAFSPDSRQIILLSSNTERIRKAFDLADLPEITEPVEASELTPATAGSLNGFLIHPENEVYVAVGRFPDVVVSRPDGEMLYTLGEQQGIGIRSSHAPRTFSPDGSQILTTNLGTIALWDIQSGIMTDHFYGYGHFNTEPIFTHDDRMILTKSLESPGSMWDLSTAPISHRYWGDEPDTEVADIIRQLAYYPPENRLIYTVDTGDAYLSMKTLDLDTNQTEDLDIEFGFSLREPLNMRFTSTGDAVGLGVVNRSIWRIPAGTTEYERTYLPDIGSAYNIAVQIGRRDSILSGDGTLFTSIICLSPETMTGGTRSTCDATLLVWDAQAVYPVAQLGISFDSASYNQLAFSNDKRLLVHHRCSEPNIVLRSRVTYRGCNRYDTTLWSLADLELLDEYPDVDELQIGEIPKIQLLAELDVDCDDQLFSSHAFINLNGEELLAQSCTDGMYVYRVDPITGETKQVKFFEGYRYFPATNRAGTVLAVVSDVIELWGIPN